MAFAALTQFHPKLFALVAIILAFPPVFTNFGKNEGLRLSLALFLFYFFRGLVSFLLSMTDVDQSRYHPLFHTVTQKLKGMLIMDFWIESDIPFCRDSAVTWCCVLWTPMDPQLAGGTL